MFAFCKFACRGSRMHIIARKAINDAIARHADARHWLENWWITASRARWRTLQEVRNDYAAADQFECCLIFDARGNKYRLIVRVTYANEWQRGTLLIKHLLTHSEYDKDLWKKDCEELEPN
jgi:mRNA interferase HigB